MAKRKHKPRPRRNPDVHGVPAEALDAYRGLHGGLYPDAVVAVPVREPAYQVGLGTTEAVEYRKCSDDHDGKGRSCFSYRHPFLPEDAPELVFDDGKHLGFAGGNYTVTDHGIEDNSMKRKNPHHGLKRSSKGRFLPSLRHNPFMGHAGHGHHGGHKRHHSVMMLNPEILVHEATHGSPQLRMVGKLVVGFGGAFVAVKVANAALDMSTWTERTKSLVKVGALGALAMVVPSSMPVTRGALAGASVLEALDLGYRELALDAQLARAQAWVHGLIAGAHVASPPAASPPAAAPHPTAGFASYGLPAGSGLPSVASIRQRARMTG